jgi:hypothetical protein
MKVTHFTMATPVNCSFTYENSFCSHDICRIKHEAERDWNNVIECGLDKAEQHDYFMKFRKALKSIRDIWAIFWKHDISLVPPEWQEFYFKYLEREALEKQGIQEYLD